MTLGTRILLIIALFCTAEGFAVAREQPVRSPSGPVLSVPVGSPAQLTSLGQHEVAKFNGQFELQGTYHYGYLTNNPEADSSYGVLELTFDPDSPYVRKLPFWRGFQPPNHLRISNPAAFVKAVVSEESTAKLKRKEVFSISGRAKILVDDYKAWLECDSAHYSVRFVALVQPRPVRLAQDFVRQYGC